jgi:uncharacterized phage protein (TIGR02216 family)
VSSFGQGAARLCHFAAILLGWRPDEFWDATPAELALALQPAGDAAEPLDRATIDELKRRFPDQLKV